VLDILARIESLVNDPVYQPNASWINAQPGATPEDQAHDLIDLFAPSGFAISARVFYPTEIAGDDQRLYYDAQIIGMLSVVDINAEHPADCFGIDLIIDGEYYDTDGNVTGTVTDSAVCNLTAELFTYSEGEVELDWEGGTTITQPYFQFAVDDFDLHLPVDVPLSWQDMWAHVDLEVMAGSAAYGAVPEPASLAAGLLSLMGLAVRRPR
jgi:hypothetical protein